MCLYVVVVILVETTKGVVVINLIVKAEATFQERIACRIIVLVGNEPLCISKDGLFKLTVALSSIICAKEVGEEFQSASAIGQVDTLVVDISTSLAAP